MLSSPSYKRTVFLDFRIWFWKGMYCAGTKHLIRMTDWPFMRPNVWRCLASVKLLLEHPQLFTTPGTSFKCSSTEHLVLPSRLMTKIAGSLTVSLIWSLTCVYFPKQAISPFSEGKAENNAERRKEIFCNIKEDG